MWKWLAAAGAAGLGAWALYSALTGIPAEHAIAVPRALAESGLLERMPRRCWTVLVGGRVPLLDLWRYARTRGMATWRWRSVEYSSRLTTGDPGAYGWKDSAWTWYRDPELPALPIEFVQENTFQKPVYAGSVTGNRSDAWNGSVFSQPGYTIGLVGGTQAPTTAPPEPGRKWTWTEENTPDLVFCADSSQVDLLCFPRLFWRSREEARAWIRVAEAWAYQKGRNNLGALLIHFRSAAGQRFYKETLEAIGDRNSSWGYNNRTIGVSGGIAPLKLDQHNALERLWPASMLTTLQLASYGLLPGSGDKGNPNEVPSYFTYVEEGKPGFLDAFARGITNVLPQAIAIIRGAATGDGSQFVGALTKSAVYSAAQMAGAFAKYEASGKLWHPGWEPVAFDARRLGSQVGLGGDLDLSDFYAKTRWLQERPLGAVPNSVVLPDDGTPGGGERVTIGKRTF